MPDERNSASQGFPIKRFFSLLFLALALIAPARAQTPTLSIADATTVEGNSGFRELLLPVTLSSAQTFDVSASFKTRDISAMANSDYVPQLAGQIVIKAGQTKANALVRVMSDRIEERDETFLVQLGTPKRCAIADSDAIATVKDDDYAGQISISDTSLPEQQTGQKIARLQVSLSSPPLHEISVAYQTKDDSAKASSEDYLPRSGVLLLPPGRSLLSVEVPIIGDTYSESDEKCLVRIAAAGYVIAKSLGAITILNDDGTANPLPPLARDLSVRNLAVQEPDSGQIFAYLRISAPQPVTRDTPITFTTRDGSAVSPSDYLSRSASVTIRAGQKDAYAVIPIVGDKIEEDDESFQVTLTAPGGLSGDTSALITIRDTDYAGSVSVEDASIPEMNSGPTRAGVHVSLSSPPRRPLQIDFATRSASAQAGQDFEAAAGQLLFTAGQTEITISLVINGDTLAETDEKFTVELSSAAYTLTKGIGVVTIVNDDGPVKPASNSGKIVFATSSGDPRDYSYFSQINIINADGTNRTELASIHGERSPHLSPDGSRVVWASDRNTGTGESADIYVMNADGSDEKELTSDFNSSDSPRFSPDGRKIVFTKLFGSRIFGPAIYDIEVINLDGSGARRLTNSAQDDPSPHYPQFSPDGKQIAFTRFSAAGAEIWVMNANGSGLKKLIDQGGYSLCYAPDGRIAFTSHRDGNMEIYIMNADGSNQIRLTNNAKDDYVGTFSPDGTQICFSSDRAGVSQIYVMNADGTRQSQRTSQNSNSQPSWSVGSVPAPPAPASSPSARIKPSAGHA